MPDRSKVRRQLCGTRGFTPRAAGGSLRPGCVCSSDMPVQPNQRRRKSVRGPHLLKNVKLDSATREGPDIGPTICQDRRNRSNEIQWTWHQGQLQVQAGFFLVSRSLTLSPAHVSTVGGIRHLIIFPAGPKEKKITERNVICHNKPKQFHQCGYQSPNSYVLK